MTDIQTVPAGETPADHRPLTDILFEGFDLHPLLLQGLEDTGFLRCTPIQALTLPIALAGRDVAGQAQTGTGKTAAFLVALFNRLLKSAAQSTRGDADPRAVVLAPTRELAIQIDKDARAIGRHTGLRVALVYGGVDYDKQRELLQRGTDVIIATPGRLIDYVKQHKVVSLHACEMVVLDEADRMFDLGFIKDIRFLLRRMPPREQRQSLLFSATLSHRVLELAYEHMNSPEKLTVETETVTAERVRQKVYFPAMEEKLPLLIGLLSRMDAHRTMVFVNTKAWVERVARELERAGFAVGVLSGDVPQKKRETLLGRFQRGELEILVATDVAARGLHIAGVSHVFNFDLPFDAEDYVHRIGRTARLGAEGDAISFACELYAMGLPDIEAYIEQKLPVEPVEPALLIAAPRSPREKPAGEHESISQLFAEARANEPPGRRKEGKGGGRSGPRRDGERGPRREGERGERGPRRDGAPRAPRPEGDGASRSEGERASRPDASRGPRRDGAPRPPREQPAATAASSAPPIEQTLGPDGQPRKRRRRGGRGRRRRDGEALPADVAAGTQAAPRELVPAEPTGLLGRIKQGLKGLINRLPGRGRRR
ncbi:MAG: ATP-dependent RNA helicase RhlB [Pseudomonadota bacterium]